MIVFVSVSRLICQGENYEMDLELDVNSDLFRVRPSQKLSVVLARTLSLDGTPDDGTYNAR